MKKKYNFLEIITQVDQAMEEIFEFLLSSQECQFNIAELQQAIIFSDITPSENTIKQRLKNRFSDKLFFQVGWAA